MILVIALGILFAVAALFGVRRAALTVILMRPSCDPGFWWANDLLHQSMKTGAAINLLVIGLAVIVLVHVPRLFLSPPLLPRGAFLLAPLLSLAPGLHPP